MNNLKKHLSLLYSCLLSFQMIAMIPEDEKKSPCTKRQMQHYHNKHDYSKKQRVDDMRPKKIFFISECLVNQNIRAYGVRNIEGEGPVASILQIFIDRGIGFSVVPCPELPYEGLKRRACGKSRYQTEEYRVICKQHALDLVERLRMFLDDGYQVGGFVCINGSPTCAIDFCFGGYCKGKCYEPGVFIEEVQKQLAQQQLFLNFIGYDKWDKLRTQQKIIAAIEAMK